MALTRRQFDILEPLMAADLSQRQLRARTGMSLGTVNRTVRELTEAGLLAGGTLTDAGRAALEPYRARRAVILAAGVGARLMPITLNTPKPLVRVHGRRIIDGLIDACLAAGIGEIWVVRGYLAEQFDLLLKQYPMLRFLENPDFNEANNIASALAAKDLLSNAYVLEADLLLRDPGLIRPYHFASNFLGVKTACTDDWCVTVRDGAIRDMRVGGAGEDIWRLYGVSYWTAEDGRQLAGDIEAVYRSPGGRERYWDQVPLVFRRENYRVELRECAAGDIVEIDTLRELRQLDRSYDL